MTGCSSLLYTINPKTIGMLSEFISRRVPAGLWRALCIASMLASLGRSQNDPASSEGGKSISMTFESGRVSAKIRSLPLHLVSERISVVTGVKIALAETLAPERVSADWKGALIADALRELLSEYDVFFFHSPGTQESSTLRAVWVYPKGSASVLKPLPPGEWASSSQLEKMVQDSDPAIRLAAWDALIDRRDPRSHSLLMDALRGISEIDAGVRERLLSGALTRGSRVPTDLLADLARGDPSSRIRWIALDALSEEPLRRQIAETLIHDPDEAVRTRAKELIAQQ